jgi:hypothetical protein
MSDIVSFGNIVNSLMSVRNDYNEHLKSIPQYDAFLLVESSTQKVADTLQGIANSSSPSMAGEVIATLELARSKFRQHLTSVPEYRALLAIDKLISDVSADLGVGSAAQSTPAVEVAPAVADAGTTSGSDAAEQSAVGQEAAPQAEVAQAAASEPTPPAEAEVAQDTPTIPASVPQTEVVAELAAAEPSPIAEVAATEQTSEHAEEVSQPAVAEQAPLVTVAEFEVAEHAPAVAAAVAETEAVAEHPATEPSLIEEVAVAEQTSEHSNEVSQPGVAEYAAAPSEPSPDEQPSPQVQSETFEQEAEKAA